MHIDLYLQYTHYYNPMCKSVMLIPSKVNQIKGVYEFSTEDRIIRAKLF